MDAIATEELIDVTASPDKRKALARLVFETIGITHDRVMADVPQSDFAPLFVKRAQDEGPLVDYDKAPPR